MKNEISNLSNYSLTNEQMNTVTGGVLQNNGSGSYAGVAGG